LAAKQAAIFYIVRNYIVSDIILNLIGGVQVVLPKDFIAGLAATTFKLPALRFARSTLKNYPFTTGPLLEPAVRTKYEVRRGATSTSYFVGDTRGNGRCYKYSKNS
jgi:hypothetical protein